MSGNYSPKRSLLPWAASPATLIAFYLLPVLSGFTAIGLHGAFRYPLNIPGHHGLEFMALLTAASLYSGKRESGFLFSLGAGIGMPLFGILNPFSILAYLLPGVIFGLLSGQKKALWLLPLTGGLAYLSIPLFRLLVHFLFGVPVMSFAKYGYFLTSANFFVFGLLGSLIALALYKSAQRLLKQ